MTTTIPTFRPGAFFIPNKGKGEAGRFLPCKADDEGMPMPETVQFNDIIDAKTGEFIWHRQSYDSANKAMRAATTIFLDVEEDEEVADRRDEAILQAKMEKERAKLKQQRMETRAVKAFMIENGIRSIERGKAAYKEAQEAAEKLAERKEAAKAAKAAK